VLPLSIASILSSLYGHPVATYILSFYHLYASPFLSFSNIPTQDVTNPVSLSVPFFPWSTLCTH